MKTKTKKITDNRIYSVVGLLGHRRSSLSLTQAQKLAEKENGKIYYLGALVSDYSKRPILHCYPKQ